MADLADFRSERYPWIFAGRIASRRRTQRPIRVLLVDDNEAFLDALELTLAGDARVEVVGRALDGAAALELVPRLHPDVVVMDLEMPRLDGIESTRRLRGFDPTARVVVLSGDASPGSVERAYEAGAVAYVTKDRPTGDLVEAIEKAVDVGRPFGVRFLLPDPDVFSPLPELPLSA